MSTDTSQIQKRFRQDMAGKEEDLQLDFMLMNLPKEVLILIFGYLRESSLLKLMLTCKATNQIIHNFKPLWCKLTFRMDYSEFNNLEPFEGFNKCQTILNSDRNFGAINVRCIEDWKELTHFGILIKKMSLNIEEISFNMCKLNRECLKLIFKMLPNLTKIEINESSLGKPKKNEILPPFEHLRELETFEANLDFFISANKIETLRIRFYTNNDCRLQCELVALLKNQKNLEILSIGLNSISKEVMEQILQLKFLVRLELNLDELPVMNTTTTRSPPVIQHIVLNLNLFPHPGVTLCLRKIDDYLSIFLNLETLKLTMADEHVMGTSGLTLKKLNKLKNFTFNLSSYSNSKRMVAIKCNQLTELISYTAYNKSLEDWCNFAESNPNVRSLTLIEAPNINNLVPLLTHHWKQLEMVEIRCYEDDSLLPKTKTVRNILTNCKHLKKITINSMYFNEEYDQLLLEFSDKLADIDYKFST